LDVLAATEATESQGEAVDAATRRQRTAALILRGISLKSTTDAAKYVLITSAAPDIQAEAVAQILLSCGFRLNPVLSLRLARATIEAAQGTEATAAALDTLRADESWQLLSGRVRTAQIGLAQLLADNGADVFVTRNQRGLLCTDLGRLRSLSALKVPSNCGPCCRRGDCLLHVCVC
jgi:hypothetical protein